MPGFELIGKEEFAEIEHLFKESKILFRHSFDHLRNNIYKVKINEIISIKFIPIKNVRSISFSINSLFTEKIRILNKYPIAFEIKNVWTPNIKIPTMPLIKATYFAPTTPVDVLKITGNGSPCFWDGLPI